MVTKDRSPRILLVLLPFWTPQVPPLGIACLKGFLGSHGYEVTIADANIEEELRRLYEDYFNQLREYVSQGKRGNFYNIGHDVLHDHLMAHLHCRPGEKYDELVATLVARTFYCQLDDRQVARLNQVAAAFYRWLEGYVLELLARVQPTVLGLSVYKGNVAPAMFAFELTRQRCPHITTVMGGAIFAQALAVGTADFEYFLERTAPYIDKIIIGEGEHLFLKWLRGELPASQRVYTLEDIGDRVLDLDSAVLPDFSDFQLQYYPNLSAYTSRSCPFQCRFCSETTYWKSYRKKGAGQVAAELSRLSDIYAHQLFFLCDSLLNPQIDDLARELGSSDPSIYWDGYLRVEPRACDEENTLRWRRGGFYRARLGVESGSRRMLEAMGKRLTLDQVRLTILNLARVGIKTTTYWIVGYPGETEEDFRQTLALLEELKDEIYEAECNPFRFYPGGQVNSAEWSKTAVPLYPPAVRQKLMLQTWVVAGKPSRQETFHRLNRFVRHCRELGIPNPYSIVDIYEADERWQKLQRNAVPPLIEFKNRDAYIRENKQVRNLSFIRQTLSEEGDFDF